MSIESQADLDGLRRAGRITRATLDALETAVRPGMTTGDLDSVAGRVFAKYGARSAPTLVYGFPGHVLLSVNNEIVHGVPGPRVLQRADLETNVIVECDGYRPALEDANGWTIRTRDGSLSAHDEHIIVITRGAPVILTAA